MTKTPSDIRAGMCVAVLGLGVTGRAAVRFCLQKGAHVRVSDSRSAARLMDDEKDLLSHDNVEWEAGGHSYTFLQKAELVIISPGIPDDLPVVQALRDQGVPVVGELAIAAPCINTPVVAVTGTNGKTTVTSLIGEICTAAGKNVFVGGNIGTPLFDFLLSGERADVFVLEVSSFQLENAGSFAPEVGVLLNITPDHIDRHHSLERYAEAKMRLFAHQKVSDHAVLCRDDGLCMSQLEHIKSQIRTFGRTGDADVQIDGSVLSCSMGDRAISVDLEGAPLGTGTGVLNAAAALLAALALGIDPEVVRSVLRSFIPGPHRMQTVAVASGVTFVNDSKATNTGAVIAALDQFDGKVILIAGGKDKGEDYTLLKDAVARIAREVILIGEAAPDIRKALNGCVPICEEKTMEDAVNHAGRSARPGDTVLLSPACASFDMFNSYGHRGKVFTEAVHRLIAEDVLNRERADGC